MLKPNVSSFWDFLPPPDERTEHLFLANSAYSLLTIYTFYLLIIYKIGPALMKNRPAFKLTQVIIAYNVSQVFLNLLVVILSIPFWPDVNIICGPIDKSINLKPFLLTRLAYGCCLLKLLDLVETVFFVLRKKNNQASTLHVYHHISMVYAGWTGVRYYPGGQFMYVAVVNSAVHVVMYFYYLLSIWNPTHKTSIWKKHLTQLQIAHQIVIFGISASPILIKDCFVPKFPCYALATNCLVIILMFINFYAKTYVYNKKPSSGKKNK